MIRDDAGQVAVEEDAGTRAVHVYFPDPWPKARHNRRRLVQPAFLDHVARVLLSGGRLQIVTDHPDYGEHIASVLADHDGPLQEAKYRPAAGAREGELVGTNFERKYIPEGRKFRAFARVKK